MRIDEFVWPQEQIDHIGEHGVTREEFEQVFAGGPLITRAPSEGENPVYNVLGRTRDGRYLFCIIIHLPDGKGIPESCSSDDRQRKTPLSRLEKPMKKMRIPKTDSIKALAHFFDTHDMGDCETELVEVTEPVFAPRNGVVVRLEPRQLAAVQEAWPKHEGCFRRRACCWRMDRATRCRREWSRSQTASPGERSEVMIESKAKSPPPEITLVDRGRGLQLSTSRITVMDLVQVFPQRLEP